jgi:hypothetical protein
MEEYHAFLLVKGFEETTDHLKQGPYM